MQWDETDGLLDGLGSVPSNLRSLVERYTGCAELTPAQADALLAALEGPRTNGVRAHSLPPRAANGIPSLRPGALADGAAQVRPETIPPLPGAQAHSEPPAPQSQPPHAIDAINGSARADDPTGTTHEAPEPPIWMTDSIPPEPQQEDHPPAWVSDDSPPELQESEPELLAQELEPELLAQELEPEPEPQETEPEPEAADGPRRPSWMTDSDWAEATGQPRPSAAPQAAAQPGFEEHTAVEPGLPASMHPPEDMLAQEERTEPLSPFATDSVPDVAPAEPALHGAHKGRNGTRPPPFARGLQGVDDLPELQPRRGQAAAADGLPAAAAAAAPADDDEFEILVDDEILELDPDDLLIDDS